MGDFVVAHAETVVVPGLASSPTLVLVAPNGEARSELLLADGPTRLGHYVLLHELGRGGMGVVYAAYDERLDRKVAIKVLRVGGDPWAQRRLVREAKALAQLSHANVVQIYEIGEVGDHDEQAFLAMEFIDGITLRRWCCEQARTRAEILAVFTAAGRGLVAAHAKGLIHRDFKPDNVMIHRDGRVLVTDFGLVRGDGPNESTRWSAPPGALRAGLTQFGAVMGTPGYMPPEQFAGRETDARSDQFSFCVSLWEALHGDRPFVGRDSNELEEAILASRFTVAVRSDVPTWLRLVLVRGLACEPCDRWPSMSALLAALARDPTPRRRAVIAAVGVVGVALAFVGGVQLERSGAREAAIADCETAAAAITADWNDDVAAEVERRFLATGRGHAAADWAHTRPRMDGYTREWSAVALRVCMEARVEGTRDATSRAEIAACLDESRASLAGLVDAWAEVDEKTLRMASTAAAGLPQPSMCLDELALARQARVPEELRARVAEVQLRLGRVVSQRIAGAHEDALARALALLPDALATGWLPTIAQVRLEIGHGQAEHGDYEAARATLEQSYVDATGAGDEPGMLAAAAKLSHLLGQALDRPEEAHVWGRIGAALVTRLGLHGTVREASLLNSVGTVYLEQADYPRALDHYRRALAIYEPMLGADHPTIATTLNNIATVLRNQGDHAAALAPYQRALRVREAAQGPEHPANGYHLHGLGLSRLALGDLVGARADLERAVALRERTGEPAKLAASRFGLAKALWADGERVQALELALLARDGFRTAGPGGAKDLARVEAWLVERTS